MTEISYGENPAPKNTFLLRKTLGAVELVDAEVLMGAVVLVGAVVMLTRKIIQFIDFSTCEGLHDDGWGLEAR